MVGSEEKQILNAEEMLKALGVTVSYDVPPDREGHKGYIKIEGPKNMIAEVVIQMAVSTYGEADGYQRTNTPKWIRKCYENGEDNSLDADIWGNGGKKRMVRVISWGPRQGQSGNMWASFGGGGHQTTFSETEAAFNQAVGKAFEVLQAKS